MLIITVWKKAKLLVIYYSSYFVQKRQKGKCYHQLGNRGQPLSFAMQQQKSGQ